MLKWIKDSLTWKKILKHGGNIKQGYWDADKEPNRIEVMKESTNQIKSIADGIVNTRDQAESQISEMETIHKTITHRHMNRKNKYGQNF